MDRDIEQRILRSPKIQAMITEDQEAEFLRVRVEPARELEAIGRERGQVLPPLQRATKAAGSKRDVAEKALDVASEELRRAERAERDARSKFESRVKKIEAGLRASAPPEIEDFCDELRDLHEATRRIRAQRIHYGRRDLNGFQPFVTNQASIEVRLEAIRDVRRALDPLRLLALRPEELEARLAELRGTIPKIEPPSAFIPEGEKPASLPTPPDTEPTGKSWVQRGSIL